MLRPDSELVYHSLFNKLFLYVNRTLLISICIELIMKSHMFVEL
jgi:hypothetical protein